MRMASCACSHDQIGHFRLQLGDSMLVRELSRQWVKGATSIWSDLVERSNANSVFCGWAWISSWIDTLGERADIRILGVFDGEVLVALAPLQFVRSSANLWGGRLSLAGVEGTGADYSDILCAQGAEVPVARALAGWLAECRDWVQCEFEDVLPTAVIKRVVTLLPSHNIMEDRVGSTCPRMSLVRGWRGFLLERFDRKQRYNIERQLRLAEEKDGLHFVLHESADAVSQAFPILVALHNERKVEQGVDSAFSRSDRLAFHKKAAISLAEFGSAFIATIETDHDALAAAYCFRDSETIYYFQTGLSKKGAAYGAGSTLLYMLLRWSARQGYQWFDFLKGDEAYKRPWATDLIKQRHILVVRPSVKGQLKYAFIRVRRMASVLCKHGMIG